MFDNQLVLGIGTIPLAPKTLELFTLLVRHVTGNKAVHVGTAFFVIFKAERDTKAEDLGEFLPRYLFKVFKGTLGLRFRQVQVDGRIRPLTSL